MIPARDRALDAADADAELVPLPRRVAAGLRGGPGRRQRRVRAPQGGDAHAAVVNALGPRAVELREREPRLRSREVFCRASRTRREQTIRPTISLGDDVSSRSNSLEHRRGTPRRASAPSARSAANASAKPSRSDDSTSLSRSSRQTGAAPSSTRTVRISSQTGSHLPSATGVGFFFFTRKNTPRRSTRGRTCCRRLCSWLRRRRSAISQRGRCCSP